MWLVTEEPAEHQFVAAVDQGQRVVGDPVVDAAQRTYIERLTKLRLHQPAFRSRVLFAYDQQCAVCRLRHLPLLDAAHIVPDSDPDGLPVVPNGLATCKIHHAAYDADNIGVRPDLTVDVRADVSAGIDGPMLLQGLREMRDGSSCSPARDAHPDVGGLERRYDQFLHASRRSRETTAARSTTREGVRRSHAVPPLHGVRVTPRGGRAASVAETGWLCGTGVESGARCLPCRVTCRRWWCAE